jgi:hypothetical protein
VNEPRRLLADGETSELGRTLLAAGRARREHDGARDRVWAAIATAAASSAASASLSATKGAAGTGVKTSAVAATLTKAKLVVVGAALLATATTAVVVTRSSSGPVAAPLPPVTQPVPPSPPSVVATTPEAIPTTEAPPVTSAPPVPRAKVRLAAAAPAKHVASGTLQEDASLLRDARVALGRGDTRGARAKIEEARARFPQSQLAQERDALEVRLVREEGDPARAAALARAFVDRYPDSPLRGGIEGVVRAAENE